MPLSETVRYLNTRNRVRHPELNGSGDALDIQRDRVVAQFGEFVLSSRFSAIVEVSRGRAVAHEAVVTTRTRGGALVSNDALFSRPLGDEEVVYLDRLCRTMHALNFVEEAPGSRQLVLDVNPRHLSVVRDHGTVFETILKQAGLSSDSVVIQLAADAVTDFEVLRQAFRNFRGRGFRVALDRFGRGRANVDCLWELVPDVVRFDARLVANGERDTKIRWTLPRLIQVARAWGARVAFPGIDTDFLYSLARDSGADWVQGDGVAARASVSERPSAPPRDD